jgi:methylenetetrahydrofolate--tRNA-(uracil-5-)-methyltransferase
MKPVGLIDPKTGRQPFAVVQLRQENREASMYNLVGFQTSLKRGEQKRIFRTIPGLEEAEFLRYGSLHRNTFINAPLLLTPTLQHRRYPKLFFAGQLTGVEGYLESTAMGLLAGIYAARLIQGRDLHPVPNTTAHGALVHYLVTADPKHFQPMNMNYGLLPPLPQRVRHKQERAQLQSERALKDLTAWRDSLNA